MRNLIAAVLIAAMPVSAAAQEYERRNPFDQGSISASLGFGASSYATGGTYYILGGGIGYFIWDGLELSFDVEHWFGSQLLIDITKISPGVRYILWQLPVFHPYAGVFYRHWFLHSDLVDDADTIGARVGAIYAPGRLYIGVGGMYEFVLTNCSVDCGAWSPEISIGVTF